MNFIELMVADRLMCLELILIESIKSYEGFKVRKLANADYSSFLTTPNSIFEYKK